MNTEEVLMQLLEGQKQINSRLDKIDNRLDKIDDRLDIIEENTSITRTATNRNGEQLDELVTLLQDTGVISR